MSNSVNHLLHYPLLYYLLLLLLPVLSTAQNYKNITLGSSITSGSADPSWSSPSGDFAFGFRPIEDHRFLLAIWFDKVDEKTVVWFPNGDIQIPKGSKVELTTDGQLILNDPQGKMLWSAGQQVSGATYAAMLDSGNFILASRSSADNLWESFKNPTDTILPTQKLEVNSIVSSRLTKTSYLKGRFRLRLLEDGNLVLNIAASPSLTEVQYDAYYWTNTANNNRMNAGYEVVFNQSGYLYVKVRNGTEVFLTSQNTPPASDVYYRATLDFDGVFTQYSHPRRKNVEQRWSTVWSAPDDICKIGGVLGSGACGYNSYCLLTSDLRPQCECPPKFVFTDPNNRYGGCRPDFVQGCQLDEWKTKTDSFELETLEDIDWPTSDYEMLESYSEEQCRTSCLNDCLCDVAIVRVGNCWKKKLPLSNGRFSNSMNGKALIKVRRDNSPGLDPYSPSSAGEKKDRSTFILVGSLLLGSSVFFNFMLLAVIIMVVFFFKDRKNMRKNNQDPSVLRSNLRSFTYQELKEATDGFKEVLGRGAFGIVYKGVVEEMGSRNYVAVKKLDKLVEEGEKEFKTEVSVIGQTHHKNLVRLLGYSEEGQNRILVYEFMNNSNLGKHLFGISKPNWNQRVQIAFGIARGLMYLHEECSSQIIHCDVKPQNILLDDSFTAKISDFGLAKLLMHDQTRTRTGVRGTRGYVAPDWFRNTPITVKVDVYSFGVVLLELISCRKGIELEQGGEEKALLTDWAYGCYTSGKLKDLVEEDEEAMNDMRRLERMVMIAIWCIQDEPTFRPSMKKVTQMLEGVIEVSVPPSPYPFSTSSGNYTQL